VFVVDRKFRLDKKTAIVDAVAANFDDGILEITVPKNVLAGPRTIPIAVTSTSASVESGETNEDEDDASRKNDDRTEDTAPDEEQDHPETAISVETVQEEDKTDGEGEDEVDEEERAEAHSSGDDAADAAPENKKSKEDDDAWEEVAEE